MSKLKNILNRLEKQAEEKYTKRWHIWEKDFPFPGGVVDFKEPRDQASYIVTINLIKKLIEDGIDDIENIESTIVFLEQRRSEIANSYSQAVGQINRKLEQLKKAKLHLNYLK